MIVHVLRRAEAGIGRVVVATDTPEIARRRDVAMAACGDDPPRPRLRLGPDLRGADGARSRGRRRHRRQRPGRPADASRRRHLRDGCRRSPIRRSTSPRWPPRSTATRNGPTRTSSRSSARRSARGGCARSISPAPPRPGARAALSPHRPLRLSPRRAGALRRAAALAAGEAREAGAACARWKPACASTSAIVDTVPLGVDTPADLERARAMLSRRSASRKALDLVF